MMDRVARVVRTALAATSMAAFIEFSGRPIGV